MSNWSRLQRVADGIMTAHRVTRSLHTAEKEYAQRIQQLKHEEKTAQHAERMRLAQGTNKQQQQQQQQMYA